MDYLIVTPPVCPPSEPASGAFTLAAGLTARGYDTALLDLSLEFFWRTLESPEIPGPSVAAALHYLIEEESYAPMSHRSSTGVLHKKLSGFGEVHPGWALSLMDITAPVRVHDPRRLAAEMARGSSPFRTLWSERLAEALDVHRPRKVLVSLAYLSQLPATLDLVCFLKERRVPFVVGGSLPSSLALTGFGLGSLVELLENVVVGDGLSLLEKKTDDERLVDRLAWPRLLSSRPYLTGRFVVPFPLSVGCYWRRCLFCPDRGMDFHVTAKSAVRDFFASMPREVLNRKPLFHLIDSAVPPASLRAFCDIAGDHDVNFYGFVRPTPKLNADDILKSAAEAGALMLQFGVESGSERLLSRFDKGLAPTSMRQVLKVCARAGIRSYVYLLFGLPGETDEDRMATLELLADSSQNVDFLNLSLFNLPRFCELTERRDEFGVILGDFPGDDELRLYRPFSCADGVPRAQARRFLSKHLEKHPAVRPIMRQTPRWLRAAHLALMEVPGRMSPRSRREGSD